MSSNRRKPKNLVLIDNINKIRDVVRTIYLYSSYDNIEVFNISPRKLREEKARLKLIFKKNYKDIYQNNKKYVGLCYNAIMYSRNFLSQIYFIKSFTNVEFILYFFILQILSKSPMSLDEILEEYEIFSDKAEYKQINHSTMDRYLKKLCEQGLIDREKCGKKYKYKIKEDFFNDFTTQEKEAILMASIFYSEITPYKVPGYYLQETLKSYNGILNLGYYDNKLTYKDWYFFEDNHIHNILDEVVLYDIERYKFVEIENDKLKKKICYLYKIRDLNCGRLFILSRGIDENNLVTDEYIIFRLDRIKVVKPLKKEPKNLSEVDFSERLKMWNCSIPTEHSKSLKLEKVQAIFYLDEDKDCDVYKRILKEKKWATFEKLEPGKYMFTIEVLDKKELIPWFRRYHGYVIVLDKDINEQFKKEREELLKTYGIF